MAASAVQNPQAPTESKSAKKKKAKAERTESPAPAAPTPEKAASIAASANQDDASENPYIRELQKNIRNVNKKITNLAKIESVVAEHPGQTLDELVSAKVINADQKASLLKKPALQSQLAQYDEQLTQHKKVEADHRARIAEIQKSLTDKAEKEKSAAIAEAKAKADADSDASLRTNLLHLSQFLRLAAARRAEDVDSTADENLALEGVLLHIYSGDDNAVETMLKLVRGVEEQTTSTSGDALQTTFAQVKAAAIAHAAPFTADATATDAEAPESKEEEPEADPTVANAGLTEIEEGSAAALTNGHTEEPTAAESAPSNAEVADSAANAAGESQWDTGNNEMTMSQEWVDVKAEATETEAPAATAPAPAPAAPAPTNNQSWADDHPEAHEVPAAAADSNDGFHQVQRNRGNREGGYRGRGGDRGGYRGRGGHRGDGRGRGRGRGGDRGGMSSRPRRGGGGGDEQH